jgi:hypothetical protein
MICSTGVNVVESKWRTPHRERRAGDADDRSDTSKRIETDSGSRSCSPLGRVRVRCSSSRECNMLIHPQSAAPSKTRRVRVKVGSSGSVGISGRGVDVGCLCGGRRGE